jgi:hypothetical protein
VWRIVPNIIGRQATRGGPSMRGEITFHDKIFCYEIRFGETKNAYRILVLKPVPTSTRKMKKEMVA